MDPGWKNSIPGSWINIPDTQNWFFETQDDSLDHVRYPVPISDQLYTAPLRLDVPPKIV